MRDVVVGNDGNKEFRVVIDCGLLPGPHRLATALSQRRNGDVERTRPSSCTVVKFCKRRQNGFKM